LKEGGSIFQNWWLESHAVYPWPCLSSFS